MNSEISKYTVSIYELIENGFDFGLDKYPIFNEEYRSILNNAILNYYMFREISYVNPAIWRQRLKTRMDLIMRNKYNALYKAKSIEFNPLYNVEMHETFTHNVKNTGDETNNGEINYNSNSSSNVNSSANSNSANNENVASNNEALSLNSTFPSEEMTEDNLTSNLFIDNATKNKTKENSSVNGSQSSSENNNSTATNSGSDKTVNSSKGITNSITQETYSKDTVGSSAGLPFSRAMMQLKDFYDEYQLDQQIIDELKDLFIQIW